MKLESGDPAPQFTLPDQDSRSVSLAGYRGRKVVVYFYPQDDTPGCTKEACQFNDVLSGFEGANVDILGISADDAGSHQRFRAKYGLGFTLLTDAGHEVATRYGAYGEKMLYGKPTVGVIRSTFLIDEEGRVERAWYGVRADGHAAKVLAEVGGAR
ncbi:MAG TPA: thioredoxin-dependent thiol peroxidase [Candidatus Dormibacteraeota bacterium]|nr:thioredoxin-dependent thiol peroxidase [Candidatus Dormibacteraeota bacterium]